nr:MAG TPA: hypothetical protein [Caudoviricetes sp.]
MEGYRDLANAVVMQAVKDYKHILHKLKKQPVEKQLLCVKGRIESFFYSEYFNILTDVDPYVIVEQLKMEASSV